MTSRMKKTPLLLLFISVFAFSLQAQEKVKIDFSDAIKTAVKNNFQIKQNENTLSVNKTTILSEKMDALPNFSAGASVNRTSGFQFNQLTQELGDFIAWSINGQITTNWAIFTGLSNLYQLRAAEAGYLSQKEQLDRVKEDVIFNTASNYLRVLLDRELLLIQEENLTSAEKRLEQIQAQAEVGSVPPADVFNQESQVANIELQVIQQENALRLDEIRLLRTMQVDPDEEYEFIAPDIDESQLRLEIASLDELLAEAYRNRSDLASQEATIKQNKYNLKDARAAFSPTLSLNGTYGSNYNDRQLGPDRKSVSFSDQFFKNNPTTRLGATLNIPIFQNWNRMTNVKRQQVTYKNAQLQLQDLRLQILQEVRQAYNDYTNFVKQVQSTTKAVESSQRAYETEQERYRVGASTLIELTQANAAFVEAKSNKEQAIFNLVFQSVLLDYFLGKVSEDATLIR